MRIRNAITIASAALIALSLAGPAQAASAATTSRTPAEGTLSLVFGPSAFAAFRSAGLSFYGLGGPKVGLGDNYSMGMAFDVRAFDGKGRTFTNGESAGVVWFNGAADREVDISAPTLYSDTLAGVVTARVYANGSNLGRITLFDAAGGRVTGTDEGYTYYGQRLTLHEGVDQILNSALGTTVFTPGMRVGGLYLDVTAAS
jgi:hypothetical protein